MTLLASLPKRFVAMIYELFLLIALWFVATALFVMLFDHVNLALKRHILQVFLWCVAGVYFVWHWKKTGQTLAMKTWRLRLVSSNGAFLNMEEAVMRYVLASLGLLIFGIGFWWAFFDQEGQFLHDRLLSKRILIDVLPK